MQQEAAHPGRMLPSEDEHRSAHQRREQQHTLPTHDRVVIGASAGGIEALLMLLTHLPSGLAASLFIAQHLSPSKPSQLPTILRRAARLPVQWATENMAIAPSTIYVAPPDHHLLLLEEDGRLHLGTGPKEQRFRPSINVLFRSAAHSYGPRVIGVLLSGMNADGTEGLQTIGQQGESRSSKIRGTPPLHACHRVP